MTKRLRSIHRTMESSSNHKACLLRIESPSSGWEKSLEKLLKANDVSFTIDKRSKTVYIYGKTDPQRILEKIKKIGKRVEIVWSNHGSQKPQENRKEHFMQQCNASGSINDPYGYGLPNYHPQQCYPSPNGMNHPQQCYPPPHWMNYPQPHHQSFTLPPPYPRQLLPNEKPQVRYEFHPNEPVAKSFSPTPDPPKNYIMGDLQPGCKIL